MMQITHSSYCVPAFCPLVSLMASLPPQRPVPLAQFIDENNLDDMVTRHEPIGITDSMKLMTLKKPLVVNKPNGATKIGDLPDKDEIVDSMNKKIQFLDVLMDDEGYLDLRKHRNYVHAAKV